MRTLKEGCNTLCASLESVGIAPYGIENVYIMSHVAQAHNRHSIQPGGSALTPEQRSKPPGILSLCMFGEHPCWPSLAKKVHGRFGNAACLGLECSDPNDCSTYSALPDMKAENVPCQFRTVPHVKFRTVPHVIHHGNGSISMVLHPDTAPRGIDDSKAVHTQRRDRYAEFLR